MIILIIIFIFSCGMVCAELFAKKDDHEIGFEPMDFYAIIMMLAGFAITIINLINGDL